MLSMQLLSQVQLKDLEQVKRAANNKRINAWIECSLCDVTVEDRVELRDHHRLCHNYNFFCKVPGCPDMFQEEAALMKHFHKSHGSNYRYIQCNECSFWTYKEIWFSKHHNKHGIKMVQCEGCDKMFYNQEDCKLHSNSAHDLGTECAWCSEKISFIALKEHKNVPPCPSCKAKFRCQKLLINHLRKCSVGKNSKILLFSVLRIFSTIGDLEKASVGSQTSEAFTSGHQRIEQNVANLSSGNYP